jgi:hypothetical protein
MNEKLDQVVQRLLDQTKGGKIEWQDVGNDILGERFQVNLGDTLVLISQEEEQDEDTPNSYLVHRFQILNKQARLVAEKVYTTHNSPGQLLYISAFANARKPDLVIDNLLQKLSK